METLNVIPEEMIERLFRIKETEFADSFELGDLANECVVVARANNKPVTQEQIFIEVGRIVGKSRIQVERYAKLASFFAPEVRSKYEVLPFSHLDLAMNLAERNTVGVQWQKLLDYDLDYMTEFGLPPSASKLMTAYTWSNKKEELGGGGGRTMPDFETLNRTHHQQTLDPIERADIGKNTVPNRANTPEQEDYFFQLAQEIENHLTPLPMLLEQAQEFIRDEYPGLEGTIQDINRAIALLSSARQVLKTWDKQKGVY